MMGSLHPSDGKSESFSQIYILDPDEQTRLRMNMIGGLEPQILRELEEYLRTHNKYVDVGETGVAWDRGWMGQRNFKYVPDVKIKKDFYLTW